MGRYDSSILWKYFDLETQSKNNFVLNCPKRIITKVMKENEVPE